MCWFLIGIKVETLCQSRVKALRHCSWISIRTTFEYDQDHNPLPVTSEPIKNLPRFCRESIHTWGRVKESWMTHAIFRPRSCYQRDDLDVRVDEKWIRSIDLNKVGCWLVVKDCSTPAVRFIYHICKVSVLDNFCSDSWYDTSSWCREIPSDLSSRGSKLRSQASGLYTGTGKFKESYHLVWCLGTTGAISNYETQPRATAGVATAVVQVWGPVSQAVSCNNFMGDNN